MSLKNQLMRPFRLLWVMGTLWRCRIWLMYVQDPLTRELISILHDGAALAYSLLKYRWMPKYQRGRWAAS